VIPVTHANLPNRPARLPVENIAVLLHRKGLPLRRSRQEVDQGFRCTTTADGGAQTIPETTWTGLRRMRSPRIRGSANPVALPRARFRIFRGDHAASSTLANKGWPSLARDRSYHLAKEING